MTDNELSNTIVSLPRYLIKIPDGYQQSNFSQHSVGSVNSEIEEINMKEDGEEEDVDQDSDSNEGRQYKKKKRNKFNQKFKRSWQNEENKTWLTEYNNKSKCKACDKIIVGGITHITRHSSSKYHIKMMKRIQSTPQINNFTESSKSKMIKERRVAFSNLSCGTQFTF